MSDLDNGNRFDAGSLRVEHLKQRNAGRGYFPCIRLVRETLVRFQASVINLGGWNEYLSLVLATRLGKMGVLCRAF